MEISQIPGYKPLEIITVKVFGKYLITQKKIAHLECLSININTENKPQNTPNILTLFITLLFCGLIL